MTRRPACHCCGRRVRILRTDPPCCARCRTGHCRRCRLPDVEYPRHCGNGRLSEYVLARGGDAFLDSLAERARRKLPLFGRRSDRVES